MHRCLLANCRMRCMRRGRDASSARRGTDDAAAAAAGAERGEASPRAQFSSRLNLARGAFSEARCMLGAWEAMAIKAIQAFSCAPIARTLHVHTAPSVPCMTTVHSAHSTLLYSAYVRTCVRALAPLPHACPLRTPRAPSVPPAAAAVAELSQAFSLSASSESESSALSVDDVVEWTDRPAGSCLSSQSASSDSGTRTSSCPSAPSGHVVTRRRIAYERQRGRRTPQTQK